ncbi:MAG: hypothetical protein AUG44_25310 [Actinobacteria bacterium 13_1_20CM_3_71_11]|nr:MAG: hypothetical protein AUG44_25310 [Actinobacteria bacterium 13_1_20CM_3_71_11]
MTNTGNIRLHPVAHLRVSGFRLPERDVPMSPIEELLPGSTVTVTGRLMPAPKFGIGRAVLTVDDGVGHKPTADVSLRLMPLWAALLVLVLLVMVTVVAVWLLEAWRRRRNRQAPRHRARRSARSRGGRAVQRPASV